MTNYNDAPSPLSLQQLLQNPGKNTAGEEYVYALHIELLLQPSPHLLLFIELYPRIIHHVMYHSTVGTVIECQGVSVTVWMITRIYASALQGHCFCRSTYAPQLQY